MARRDLNDTPYFCTAIVNSGKALGVLLVAHTIYPGLIIVVKAMQRHLDSGQLSYDEL